MHDKELLNQLRTRFDCSSDAQLAEVLGISCGHLSLIRNGHREMSTKLRLHALDKLGFGMVRDALLAVTPKKLSDTLRRLDNERAQKNAGGSDEFSELEQLLDVLKKRHSTSVILKKVKTFLA